MQYIEVNGEKIEVLEIVQEDAENEATLVTTEDQTQWVDSKEIKLRGGGNRMSRSVTYFE